MSVNSSGFSGTRVGLSIMCEQIFFRGGHEHVHLRACPNVEAGKCHPRAPPPPTNGGSSPTDAYRQAFHFSIMHISRLLLFLHVGQER